MALARVRVSNDMNEKLNVQFIIFFFRDFAASAQKKTFARNILMTGKISE